MPYKRRAQKKAAPASKRPRADIPPDEELVSAQASKEPEADVQAEESVSMLVDEDAEMKEVRSGKGRAPKRVRASGKAKKVKVKEEPKSQPSGGASSANVGPPEKLDEASDDEESECRFLGDPIPQEEARTQWPKRYRGVFLILQVQSFPAPGSVSVTLRSSWHCTETNSRF